MDKEEIKRLDDEYVLVKKSDLMRLREHAFKLEGYGNIMREGAKDIYYEIGDILNSEEKPSE